MTTLDHTLAALRAVAEETRLRILALAAEGELTVSEFVRILNQSQPRVSRHVKILAEAGLLVRIREGSWVFHRLAHDGPMAETARYLASMLPDDDETLVRDRERFAEIKAERARAAADYFDLIAADWNELRSLHVDEARVEKAVLDALPKSGINRYLDIGTGTGRILSLVAPRAEHGYGIDLSREMLAVARNTLEQEGHRHCEVRQADLNSLPFPGECFDAITIHQVLHYLPDPANAVAEAARVLKPGGRLVIADFAPHDREALRTEHQHRRLGFGDDEVDAWCAESGLALAEPKRLKGGALTVTVWLADKRRAGATETDPMGAAPATHNAREVAGGQ